MWRGQADIDWRVDSAAYRRLNLSPGLPNEQSIINYEKRLIRKARYRGYDIRDGQQMSDFDVLARLQHHGAATRLLDATRSALVGMYFAADTIPEKYGVLLGFHSHNLGGYEELPEMRSYDEVVMGLDKHEYSQTWQPPDVSKRIAAQHSQFLYSSVQNQKHGSVGLDQGHDSMMALAISPKLKPNIIKVLSETFDIRLPTLFPDLAGFCEANSVRFSENFFSRW